MVTYDNILVVVDHRQEVHHALSRAVELANNYDSNLTLAISVDEPVSDLLKKLSQAEVSKVEAHINERHLSELDELAKPLREQGLKVSTKVIWDTKFHRGIITFAKQQSFDLIVKTAHYHNQIQKLLITPSDWHLMRESGTNLLLVKQGRWPDNSNILGAIDIDAKDQSHSQLNIEIIEHCVSLADKFKVKPHVINVFPWPLIEKRQLQHLFDQDSFYKEGKELHAKALKDYVSDFSIADNQLHLAEGVSTEEAIPEIVKATQSHLLVIGTVGRKGLSGVVIGNTAEKIIDNLNCEVLALQPNSQ